MPVSKSSHASAASCCNLAISDGSNPNSSPSASFLSYQIKINQLLQNQILLLWIYFHHLVLLNLPSISPVGLSPSPPTPNKPCLASEIYLVRPTGTPGTPGSSLLERQIKTCLNLNQVYLTLQFLFHQIIIVLL